MIHLNEVLFLFLAGIIITIFRLSSYKPQPFFSSKPFLNNFNLNFFNLDFFNLNFFNNTSTTQASSHLKHTNTQKIQDINTLADCHEIASRLSELIRKDGAGSWPPNTNHLSTTWPASLRPYKEIYTEMAPLLPAAHASLDDNINHQIISSFRSRFRQLLSEKVNLDEVTSLLSAAASGRWDVFPRDTYNAFYSCLAWCRHAYRWASIPVVSLAQREDALPLPRELVVPWNKMQAHFQLASDSGNNMSNLVLNFNNSGEYQYKINTGLSQKIVSSEGEFTKIFYEVETLAVPIYHAMVRSIVAFARENKKECLRYVREVNDKLRPLLGAYYESVHESKIKRDVWLSRVQGFYAWGMTGEERDVESQELIRFDGLSGNQVLLFQALDAYLGMEPYLTREVMDRNVPGLQRGFVDSLGRFCFRGLLKDGCGEDGEIKGEMLEIVKRMRVFRSAHRTRAKVYLSVPAPERMPMTAGKSLLKDDSVGGIDFLDQFMVKRLQQTV
ncbi:hypothetical protein QBC38DRAFT_377177 [Podospora fimiseda]|uniref:Indoleamine 2,3-dioxygenase n=1 Tax=Podospora fimiseda TaxID=252190 RepID=A0AAN6YN36_9PEZI|nr:hypothetical protein QBC38DRAFT_377177 [Podospora fimiseda]